MTTDTKKGYVHKPRDLGGLPRFSEITGIQAAFVDNGAKKKTAQGRTSTAIRHKMIVEVWTVPAERLNKQDMQFKRNVELRTPNEFQKLITDQKTASPPVIGPAYHDHLMDVMMAMPLEHREKCLFGQIRENKDGWRYFPFEYLVFDQSGDMPVLFLFQQKGDEMDMMSVPKFNGHFANPPIELTAYLDVNDQLKQYKESRAA